MRKSFLPLLLCWLFFAAVIPACAEDYFFTGETVRAAPALPEQWRDAMIQTLDEANLPLDGPFICSPFSEQLYAPNPAPDWLVYEATAAEGTLYLRQILVDKSTPVTYYVTRMTEAGREMPSEAFVAIAQAAMQAMEPTLTPEETADILAALQNAHQNDHSDSHHLFLRGFVYSISLTNDGTLWDITIEYTSKSRWLHRIGFSSVSSLLT